MSRTAEELPRVLQLLWGLEGPARPGPKPTLQIGDIGRAAVKLADEAGLGAVSMSKVAAELGFTTMSLYRYVDSKDDLYVVMVEEAFGAPEPVDPDADWRARITQWAVMVRDAIHRHPWILQVPVFEPPLSPKQLLWMEEGLRAFEGTPLTSSDRLSSMVLVNIYVRGVTGLTANMFMDKADAAKLEADKVYAQRLMMLATPEQFPAIAATFEGGTSEDGSDLDNAEFDFGLTTVLDGIEALIARRAGAGRR
jgi:AcrR family transcriptional regulator